MITPNQDKPDECQSRNDVDAIGETQESSRARTQHEIELVELSKTVENDSQLHQSVSIRDIILAHPAVRVKVVATAIRSLSAKKFYFDKAKKCMVHEEDYMTQMKAVAFLAAYSDGLPAQTNLNVNVTPPNGKEMTADDMMISSPAVLDAMERAVARARSRMEKKAEPSSA